MSSIPDLEVVTAMILPVLTLSYILESTTSTPSPLREVVYKVSELQRDEVAIETYGGRVAGFEVTPSAGEPNPTAKYHATLEEGTMTIDVLGVSQDVVRLRVTETFQQRSAPLSYEAYIAPNGLVRFEIDHPSAIARYLTPLFAVKFLGSTTLLAGDSWQIDLKTDAVDVKNIFTITGQDGPLMQLDERETVRLSSARGMDYNVHGTLKYKPSLLVPITGDIEERGASGTMDSQKKLTTTVHFERVSDSRDQAQGSDAK